MSAGWTEASTICAGLELGADTRLDAYMPWDRLTDFARHRALAAATRTQRAERPAEHWPVMVQFMKHAGAQGLDGWCDDDASVPAEDADALRLAFAASVAAAPHSKLHTAILPRSAVAALLAGVARQHLERFQIGAPCVYAAPASSCAAPSPLAQPLTQSKAPSKARSKAQPGAPVHTLGIIDDGCCFAHQHFRTASGACRVHALWDQTPAATPVRPWSALCAMATAAPFAYGVELMKPALDQLLIKHPGFGERAEQALYASIGRGDWGRGGHTHGARVMHLAVAPHNWQRQVTDSEAAASPIVFVQLPWQTVRDVTGDSLGMHVVDGARYIVARAQELAGGRADWKATINISLGSIGGPHDGSSMAEQALSELVSQHAGRVTLVMAAGNTAGERQRIHAEQAVSAAAPGQFLLRLPPAHRRDCFVELWFDTGTGTSGAGSFALEVLTPDGHRLGPLKLGQAAVLVDEHAGPRAALVFARKVAQGMKDTMALLSIAPTLATPGVQRPLAATGIWQITVRSGSAKPQVVHAWVERDDSVIGRRRGQQARFEALGPATADTSVNDDMTLSNLANAENMVTVGGYVAALNKVADYSANGPLRGPTSGAALPSHFAVSDRSAWLPGLAVPGFYSGSHATINGTSAAAPQMARALMAAEPKTRTRQEPGLDRRPAPEPPAGNATPPLRAARKDRTPPDTAFVLRDGAGHTPRPPTTPYRR